MIFPMALLQRLIIAAALLAYGLPAAAGQETRLIDALKTGDRKSAQSLLEKKVDVNLAAADGTTALHWAALHDDIELAQQLIKAGADVNTSNEYGVSPLYLACTNRSGQMMKALLQAGANTNATLWSGETVLMNCARTGALEAAKLLIEAGVDVNSAEPGKGQTALMWAAAAGHARIVDLLVRSGADIRARTRPGVATIPDTCRKCDWKVMSGDFTPLLFAARSGNLETTRILLDAGADPNEATGLQGNSLVIASAGGHEDLALYLLAQGADPESTDEHGINALHHAVGSGLSHMNGVIYDNVYRLRPRNLYRLAEALIQAGVDPDAKIQEEYLLGPDGYPISMVGATPLLLAAASGDIRMMQILLNAGADPTVKTEDGVTLLMAAAQVACPGTCVYQAGGNTGNKDSVALALATVQEVLKLGVDVNEVDVNGRTALHIAAYTGSDPVVQLLASKGAAVDVENKIGETPWTMASGLSPTAGNTGLYGVHASTAELLVKLGAKPRKYGYASAGVQISR